MKTPTSKKKIKCFGMVIIHIVRMLISLAISIQVRITLMIGLMFTQMAQSSQVMEAFHLIMRGRDLQVRAT